MDKMHGRPEVDFSMKKYMLAFALAFAANACPCAQLHLRCATLPGSGKVFTFEIDVDPTKKEVFVDGQYTTNVFISNYLTSFVLADENTGYAFDIYPNGSMTATHVKNHSQLFMQCDEPSTRL